MYNRIIILFLFAKACLPGNPCFSQQTKKENKPDQYRAIHWTMQDGLSFDGGNVMIKDEKGFLWIGSPGAELCRFDGARFKKYIPDPNKRGAINSGTVTGFVEDSLNNIWIGTDKGLSRYDMKADTFSNFTTTVDQANSSRPVIPFWASSSHVYCFESGSGFARYDIRSLKRDSLLRTPGKTIDNVIQPSYIIFDSASNSLWMLEKYSQNPEGVGLLRISLDDGQRRLYPWPCLRTNITHGHGAEAMQFDRKRNSIWINSGDGLLEFTLADRKFHHADAFNEYIKLKDFDRWVGIDIDREGKIWVATHKGILIYDPETDRVQPAFSDPGLQKSVGDAGMHVYCDRDGIAWISSWQIYGLYELLPLKLSVKRYAAKPGMQDSLSNGIIWSIVAADKGKVWIGTQDGLNIFDPLTEKFEVLREKDLPGIRGTIIVPALIDTVRQKAWLYVNALIAPKMYKTDAYEMDIKTRKCRRIIFRYGTKQLDSSLFDPAFVKPYKDGILVGVDGYGLFEVKEGALFADLVAPLDIDKQFISGMVLEEERLAFLRMWNELPNLNLENKNGKWTKIPHLLDSLDWGVMIYDEKDKTHWVSFKYKLIHYNKDFREIKTYTRDEGYTASVYKMAIDNFGNLWFVNDLEQVGRLNVATGIITMLSETDGYHRKIFDWSVPLAKDARGNLYFGTGYNKGDQGLDCIYPEIFESVRTSSVYLSSLAINHKPAPLSTGINFLEKLSLRYNQNTLSIETGIIDHHAKGKGHIRYKLQKDGEDEAWQYGPAYYTIRYDGLTPGAYRLIMQSSNAGIEFNSPEKIITIIISPPFWQTPWFRILAILFVIAMLYGFIQYRSRHLKERNLLLEQKVMQRTNELNTSLAELKTTQDQLIQSEKMASLGELTSGIAHEIKNPLNFVNNFSEINTELITEIEEELIPKLDENNQARMAPFIKTLKKNLEKINHHGKRIDGIVKGMLQHSRLGNTTKESVDINSLCDESLKLAWHGFRAKEKTFNASFETRFDPDLPQVRVFPQDFGRVMINLINNAFYTVHEKKRRTQSESSADALQIESLYKPSVIVSTKKNGNKILITVSDNGMGIPSPVLNKIFQPFFTTKPTGEGTGLGLSMSYDIISKSHGGEIKAKSKAGLGTDFEIILPVS